MQIEKGIDKLVKTVRMMILDKPGHFGKVATAVGNAGGSLGDIKLVGYGLEYNTRDVTIFLDSEAQLQAVLEEVGKIEGVIISDIIDPVLEMHRGGKIIVTSRNKVDSISTVRKIYTPGVAKVCTLIQRNPELVYDYTAIFNTVAIVTNGTAILGLGDIGAVAGMPVMEGKAALFASLVGINGVPILIQSKDTEEIIRTVASIAPTFGAIKLEDIKSPECFEIEDRLSAMLDIPVLHDDQHGTSVVVLAALLNAGQYVGMQVKDDTVGMVGLGAAGIGISKLLMAFGVRKMLGCRHQSRRAGDLREGRRQARLARRGHGVVRHRHRHDRRAGAHQEGDDPEGAGDPRAVEPESRDLHRGRPGGGGFVRGGRPGSQQRARVPRGVPGRARTRGRARSTTG